jgi:hypothetical protein
LGEAQMRFLEIAIAVVELSWPYAVALSAIICLTAKAINDEIEYRRFKNLVSVNTVADV